MSLLSYVSRYTPGKHSEKKISASLCFFFWLQMDRMSIVERAKRKIICVQSQGIRIVDILTKLVSNNTGSMGVYLQIQ